MYNIGGATSSHPSESLDGFHRRENGASHAAENMMVSEVVHVDSIRPKHGSLDIPEAVVPPERDGLCTPHLKICWHQHDGCRPLPWNVANNTRPAR